VTEQVLEAGKRTRVAERKRRSGVRRRGTKSSLASSFHTPLWHRVAERMIAILALAAVLAIALIFIFIAREAVPMLWEAEFAEEVQMRDLFFSKEWRGYDEPVFIWQPVGEPAKFNVVPLFIGSLKVTLLAMLMSVPLGVGCAMFIALYAPRAVREVVKPVIELLAGIPSVVLGFFALMVLASWAQATFGFHFRLNAFVAAIGLALTIVPVIFTISEDAIQAVPSTLTEAALALGARKYQVALRVVLPAAIPGIAAGVVLGFGRAIGETMIVLMASGNAAIMELFDFSTSVRTVTATIAAELGEVAQGDPHWRVLFLLGVMLFAVTFVLNILGDLFIQRLQKKLTAS
jgi:phosphate transport system permease protein